MVTGLLRFPGREGVVQFEFGTPLNGRTFISASAETRGGLCSVMTGTNGGTTASQRQFEDMKMFVSIFEA